MQYFFVLCTACGISVRGCVRFCRAGTSGVAVLPMCVCFCGVSSVGVAVLSI
jgi:hypothetical protein